MAHCCARGAVRFTLSSLRAASNDPPACPAWGWGRIDRLPELTRNRQCFALEPTAEVASSRRNSPS